MPPISKGKIKTSKENVERKKKILASQEKILKIKRNILSIVEAMLEKDIQKKWFLNNCIKLCHADYDDVIQERSIEHMCGYPLCPNTIKQTLKQKYHISRATNKIYDITERKNFCSNKCYTASNYLKAQLSPIPLYMRKEEEFIQVNLLSDCDNKGIEGEEIVFHHTISNKDIEKVFTEEQPTNNFQNMLNEEIKKCADSLSDLQIKEHVFEKQYVFDNQITKQKVTHEGNSGESDELDSDDSEDRKLFPNYDNLSVLSDRHMPIPSNIKKSQLISPINPISTPHSTTQQLSLEFVSKIFKDWMTEGTMKYLLGEKYMYSVKADHLFETMTTDTIEPEKLSLLKNEYINLCCKIDKLPDDDLNDSFEVDIISGCEEKNVSNIEDIQVPINKKVFKRRTKKNSKDKSKKVTFANVVEEPKLQILPNTFIPCENENNLYGDTSLKSKNNLNEESESLCENTNTSNSEISFETETTSNSLHTAGTITEESATQNSLIEPEFPLVDSVSQNALRRQVLMSKLKSVYIDLLPIIGLHYTDIRTGVKKFVETLSLTPTNIIFKPKEWKLISLILLRILTRTVLKNLHDEDQLLKLVKPHIMPVKITLKEIELLVHDIISPENILTLPTFTNSL